MEQRNGNTCGDRSDQQTNRYKSENQPLAAAAHHGKAADAADCRQHRKENDRPCREVQNTEESVLQRTEHGTQHGFAQFLRQPQNACQAEDNAAGECDQQCERGIAVLFLQLDLDRIDALTVNIDRRLSCSVEQRLHPFTRIAFAVDKRIVLLAFDQKRNLRIAETVCHVQRDGRVASEKVLPAQQCFFQRKANTHSLRVLRVQRGKMLRDLFGDRVDILRRQGIVCFLLCCFHCRFTFPHRIWKTLPARRRRRPFLRSAPAVPQYIRPRRR